jgi:hypothetical protein
MTMGHPSKKRAEMLLLLAINLDPHFRPFKRNRENSGQKGRINAENRQKRRENRINKAGNGRN